MIDPAKTAELTAKGINALGWHAVSRSEETCSDCLNRMGKHWRIDGTPIQHAIPFAWPPIHQGCRCLAIPMKFPDELLAVILAGQPVDEAIAQWQATRSRRRWSGKK